MRAAVLFHENRSGMEIRYYPLGQTCFGKVNVSRAVNIDCNLHVRYYRWYPRANKDANNDHNYSDFSHVEGFFSLVYTCDVCCIMSNYDVGFLSWYAKCIAFSLVW